MRTLGLRVTCAYVSSYTDPCTGDIPSGSLRDFRIPPCFYCLLNGCGLSCMNSSEKKLRREILIRRRNRSTSQPPDVPLFCDCA